MYFHTSLMRLSFCGLYSRVKII
uniref:Uncharacterized protein n=1 Tax=Anguilla anguilla TaxID=7936 RepID=A0A0E9SM61_ANGAN